MRIPNALHELRGWRIAEIVPDFVLEDVWALPAVGGADDFDDVLELVQSLDFPDSASLPVRFVWGARDRLGAWFHLGRISVSAEESSVREHLPIPGGDETSLAARLPADLRDTAVGVEPVDKPFDALYRTDREYAAELSNRTVHAVMHLGWVDLGDGRFQAEMAVYVKPRGRFGTAYMAFIKPFRYALVYPALMKYIERAWARRTVAAVPEAESERELQLQR